MTHEVPGSLLISAREAARELGPGGEQRLFRGHQDGRIQLLGRPIEPGSNRQGKRQIIPKEYFADHVRLDRTANEIGPDGTAKDFAKFEQDLGLQRWADVKVSAAEIDTLVKSLAVRPPSTAAASTACRKWLVAEMKAHETRPRRKIDYFEDAKTKWVGISKKAFDKEWDYAMANTGRAATWGLGGRPRKRN